MKMKVYPFLVSAFGLLVLASGAQGGGDRVTLAVCEVKVAATRDAFEPVPLSPLDDKQLPYSASDMALMSPEAQQAAVAANDRVRRENYEMQREAFLANYRKLVQRQEQTEREAMGTRYGRAMKLARDYFAAELAQYGAFFDVLHRLDHATALKESQFSSEEVDFAEATYFVRLILGDVEQTTSKLPMEGGLVLTRSRSSMPLTVQVQDLRGRMIFARNLEPAITSTTHNVTISSGSEDIDGKLIRKGCQEAAEAIAGYFKDKMARDSDSQAKDRQLEDMQAQLEAQRKAMEELKAMLQAQQNAAPAP